MSSDNDFQARDLCSIFLVVEPRVADLFIVLLILLLILVIIFVCVLLGASFDVGGLARLVLVSWVSSHEGGLDLCGLLAVGLADLVALPLPLATDLLGCGEMFSTSIGDDKDVSS